MDAATHQRMTDAMGEAVMQDLAAKGWPVDDDRTQLISDDMGHALVFQSAMGSIRVRSEDGTFFYVDAVNNKPVGASVMRPNLRFDTILRLLQAAE